MDFVLDDCTKKLDKIYPLRQRMALHLDLLMKPASSNSQFFCWADYTMLRFCYVYLILMRFEDAGNFFGGKNMFLGPELELLIAVFRCA